MSMFVEYTEPQWRQLDMRALQVDEAYFFVRSNYLTKTFLYSLSDACYTCPYTKVKALAAAETFDESLNVTTADAAEWGSLEKLKLNIAHALNLEIYLHDMGHYAFDNTTETPLCTSRLTDLREFGVYNITLEENGTCSFATDKEGVNSNYSLISVFVLVAAALLLLKLISCAWRRYRYDEETAAADSIGAAASKAVQRKRMRSLDAFRGFAIVLMIFVNGGGGHYWWIEHAAWNGLHVADIVFPSFLWIMGVCIPLSIKSQLSRGTSKARICARIAWRGLKLFVIGLCLNSLNGPQLEQLRIMGVLQRFGIAFIVCGILHTVCSKREHIVPQSACQRASYDLFLFRGEFMVMLMLIATHLGIVFGLDVPNCPRGYLGPGGKHGNAAYPNCIGGATGYIDLQVLGNAHIYQHPTTRYLYDSKAFDPENIVGCLLTIVQVLFGVFAGVILLVHTAWQARIKRWLSWSVALSILGTALCGFSKENGIIPVNKNLWSLSYVCVTVSLAFALLSLLYYIIDVRQCWSAYPFVESGMNAIIMYVGHQIMHKMLPWHWRIGSMNTHFVLLLEAVWNTLLWIAIALYLDSQEFYYTL